jgi:hypothetical protein
VASYSNTIHDLNGYGTFTYSPYTECPPYDLQNIGQNFGCGYPTKARVR